MTVLAVAFCWAHKIGEWKNEMTPIKIKKHGRHAMSLFRVFAKFLNTTLSTVRQWEQGEKRPRGTSLKLLTLVAEKELCVFLSSSSYHTKDTLMA